MTKKEMLKYLILQWCKSSKDLEERKQRFIEHDSIEYTIDRKWKKEMIAYYFELYINKKIYIESVIYRLVNVG